MVNNNYYKKIGEKDEKPVDELMTESLESALTYSQKLSRGVREIIDYIEASLEESGMSRSVMLSLSRHDLPEIKDILEGSGWLISMYDKCRFFSSAPFHPLDDSIIKRKILNALKMIVDYLEKNDGYSFFMTLKFELAPGLELLGGRIKTLSKLSNLYGHKRGIMIQ